MNSNILWKCHYCDHILGSKQNVLSHIWKQHKVNGNNPLMYSELKVKIKCEKKTTGKSKKTKQIEPKKSCYDFKRLANMFNRDKYQYDIQAGPSVRSHGCGDKPADIQTIQHNVEEAVFDSIQAPDEYGEEDGNKMQLTGSSSSYMNSLNSFDDDTNKENERSETNSFGEVSKTGVSSKGIRVKRSSFTTPYKRKVRGKCTDWESCPRCSTVDDCGRCVNCCDKSKHQKCVYKQCPLANKKLRKSHIGLVPKGSPDTSFSQFCGDSDSAIGRRETSASPVQLRGSSHERPIPHILTLTDSRRQPSNNLVYGELVPDTVEIGDEGTAALDTVKTHVTNSSPGAQFSPFSVSDGHEMLEGIGRCTSLSPPQNSSAKTPIQGILSGSRQQNSTVDLTVGDLVPETGEKGDGGAEAASGKIYSCKTCGKAFSYYRSSVSHCKSKKSWVCRVCGCKIKHRNNRARHMKRCATQMETDKGNGDTQCDSGTVSCNICGKSCKNRNTLKAHTYKYHNELRKGTFHCALCGRKYESEGQLKRHEKEKHQPDAISFNCQKCEYTCKSRKGLGRHVKLVHRSQKGSSPQPASMNLTTSGLQASSKESSMPHSPDESGFNLVSDGTSALGNSINSATSEDERILSFSEM